MFFKRAGEFGEINEVQLYYNKYTKTAFASSYFWDGEENSMDITVPDTCNDCKVTELGGYHGSGAICPFGVILPEYFYGKDSLCAYMSLPEESNSSNTQTYTFKVIIGKNLKKLERIDEGYYGYGNRETQTVEQYYAIEFFYICSEENETFYSKDGVLYLKSTDEVAMYEDGKEQ